MTIIVYLVYGLSCMFLGAIIYHFASIEKNKTLTSFYQMNLFYREARVILDEVRMKTVLTNALLLHAHNGGEELFANSFHKSSVLEESPGHPEVSAIKNWINRPIDRAYRNLLEEVETQPYAYVSIDTMQEGDLKSIYILYGIKGSLIFKIYNKTKASFFYASFVTKGDIQDFRYSKDYARVLIAVQRLTELCDKYYRKNILK